MTNKWETVPIRMITGWAAKWCCLEAIFDENRKIIDFNDSEDIVWFEHLHNAWQIDAGFCHSTNKNLPEETSPFVGEFVVRFLVITENDKKLMEQGQKDWCDCIVETRYFNTPMKMIEQIEEWMQSPPVKL